MAERLGVRIDQRVRRYERQQRAMEIIKAMQGSVLFPYEPPVWRQRIVFCFNGFGTEAMSS